MISFIILIYIKLICFIYIYINYHYTVYKKRKMISITAKPFFMKDNNMYPFSNDEYSFALATLKSFFGDDLICNYENGIFTIQLYVLEDLHELQRINHFSGKRFLYDKELYEEGANLKFEVLRYTF